MPIGKLFFFVPQTSSRVDALGVMGNNYAANGGDGAYGTTTYSAHTGLNGLQWCTNCCCIASCSTKANQPITQMQAKTCTMRSTMMVYLITLKVQ
jgi:hypothetical protein